MGTLIEGVLLPHHWVGRVFAPFPCVGRGAGFMHGLSLIPISEELRRTLGSAVRGSWTEQGNLDDGLADFLENASIICPIAYIETRFGEDGRWQAAAVWWNGRLVMGPQRGEFGVIEQATRVIRNILADTERDRRP